MAEVKPIGFNYARYKAQVFDLSSLTRQMASQVAAQRKAQQEAKKEAEKTLTELANMKAAGRSQDIEYLSGVKKELTDYFSQNRDKIQPGTAEYRKFNELKTNLIYETERSKNEKEKDIRFATYASANADKMKLSDEAKEIIEIQKLDINNPIRKEWRKKLPDGRELSIDEIDINDLDKYSIFDEVELQKNIENVDKTPVETKSFITKLAGYNLGAPVIQTKTIEMRRPGAVIDMYAATFRNKERDATDKLNREWDSLTPEEKDRVNAEFRTFNKVYEAAGIKEKVTIDESDKTAGISNGFEYGAYKALKNTLPMQIREDFDTSVGNMILSQRRFSAWWQNQKQKTQGQPVYKWVAQTINTGQFNPEDIKRTINPAISSGAESLTTATPAWINIDATGKGTLLTNTPIKMVNAEGKAVPAMTDKEALAHAKKVKGVSNKIFRPEELLQTNKDGIWQDPQSKVWFQRRVRPIDWSATPGQEMRISAALREAREAQTSAEGRKLIDAMMGEKTAIEEAESSFIMNF